MKEYNLEKRNPSVHTNLTYRRVIATVLFIAITIVIVILMIGWTSKFIEESISKSQAQISLKCNDVNYKVLKACSSGSVTIENRGRDNLGFKAVIGNRIISCSGILKGYERKTMVCGPLAGGNEVKMIPSLDKNDCSNKIVKLGINNVC